ncbi:MAG: hypothetical protein JO327_07645 [Nitrososphaeraceae archaeon]|nr:hypothetical protein [Nitrososphaeraceae archaeon]
MHTNESDAADLLSEILFHNPKLNERFIEMVENIHMKQRMIGIPFPLRVEMQKTDTSDLISKIY